MVSLPSFIKHGVPSARKVNRESLQQLFPPLFRNRNHNSRQNIEGDTLHRSIDMSELGSPVTVPFNVTTDHEPQLPILNHSIVHVQGL